jgi:hypothetical protein
MNNIINHSKVLLLFSLSTLIFSCTNNSRSDEAFKALEEGLVNSNKAIASSSETIYHSLQEKLYDPATVEKARIWYPKAEMVRNLSKKMTNYIETLKTEVREEAGLQNKKANELFIHLSNYKRGLMQVDSAMTVNFGSNIVITSYSFDSLRGNQKEFTSFFFDRLSTEGIISMLNKFQNNVKINENKLLTYCLFKIPSYIDGYNWLAAFAFPNSMYLKAGDKIEITAGVGSFNRSALPKIIVRGKNIPINEMGVAIAKFKASTKPGKHFVPVEISYTDQDGKRQTIAKTIEYTVLEN